MKSPLFLFAYGSLMSERVAPGRMVSEELVTLEGYQRTFHKVSWLRGCHPNDAVLDVTDVPERFKTSERHLSLVLGLEPNPKNRVVGYLQTYPGEAASEVLEQLDRREGFDPSRPAHECAYLRRPCTVVDSDGFDRNAVTYFTNPASDMVIDELSTEEKAAILSAATPGTVAGPKARGLFYLEGVREALHLEGRHDQILEALSRCAYKWYSGSLKLLPPKA